jgi:hypothetical protein
MYVSAIVRRMPDGDKMADNIAFHTIYCIKIYLTYNIHCLMQLLRVDWYGSKKRTYG